MSNEDADAEQNTCYRDELDHSSPPSRGELSTGLFPDDFVESGKWFRRPGRRRRPSTKQLHGIAGSATGISVRPSHGRRFEQRPDIRAALAAGGADEAGFDIGEPDVVGAASSGCIGDRGNRSGHRGRRIRASRRR